MNVMSDGGGECMVQEGRKEWPGCQQTEGAPPEASAINVLVQQYLQGTFRASKPVPLRPSLSGATLAVAIHDS